MASFDQQFNGDDILLARSFERRSFCHFHLGQLFQGDLIKQEHYSSCIKDADHYLLFGMDNDTIIQVMLRKVNCLIQLRKYSQANELISEIIRNERNLSISSINRWEIQNYITMAYYLMHYHIHEDIKDKENREEDIHQITKSVEIRETPEKGRFMVAIENIPKDHKIIRENALIRSIKPKFFMDNCNYCTKFVINKFIPCHGCSKAVFCDEKCRSQAWEKYHRYECKFISLFSIQIAKPCQMIFRLLLTFGPEMALNIYDNPEPQPDDDYQLKQYKMFLTLYHHRKKQDPNTLALVTVTSIIMAHFIDYLSILNHDLSTIKKVFSFFISNQLRCIVNGFTSYSRLSIYEKVATADAICVWSALINHSCDPSVDWNVHDGQMVMITEKAIQQNKEVMISYGPNIDMKFRQRQKHLNYIYHFVCRCNLCTEQAYKEPAFQCLSCGGPVVFEKFHFDNDKLYCFYCNTQYDEAQDAYLEVSKLEGALVAIECNKQISWNDAKEKAQKCLQSLQQILFPGCKLLVQLTEKANQFDNYKNEQEFQARVVMDKVYFYESSDEDSR